MIDLVIRGGTVVDGTGAEPFRGDVGVRGGRIVAVERAIETPAAEVIDAAGLIVSPGFVDIHTHSDLTLLSAPAAVSALTQGVTTQVVGNCGLGVAPRGPQADLAQLRADAAYLDLDPAVPLDWSTTAGYLAELRLARPAVNVLSLVPHGPLRASVVGSAARASTPAEIEAIVALARAGLDEGAVGVSTGLCYPPQCYADDAELTALGMAVAQAGALFAWHMRDYADDLLDSARQCLRVARQTGCRTQISHLAAVGRRNWGRVDDVLQLVDEARADGLDVGVDCYPYLAGNAPLTQALPADVQAGTQEQVRRRLQEPAVRRAVLAAWATRPVGWEETFLSRLPTGPGTPDLVGRSVEQVARERDLEPAEFALDLLAEHGSSVLVVVFGRAEQDLASVLAHPASVVASDGLALDPHGVTGHGQPHPRSYGCFPRYLSRVGAGELSAAIRRCTAGPAARVGLTDRGRVAVGQRADLAVFDLPRFTDHSTFESPHQLSTGVQELLVGGARAIRSGVVTGVRQGTVTAWTRPR